MALDRAGAKLSFDVFYECFEDLPEPKSKLKKKNDTIKTMHSTFLERWTHTSKDEIEKIFLNTVVEQALERLEKWIDETQVGETLDTPKEAFPQVYEKDMLIAALNERKVMLRKEQKQLDREYREQCAKLKEIRAGLISTEEEIAESRTELAEVVRLCKSWQRSEARKLHAAYERQSGGIFGSILYAEEREEKPTRTSQKAKRKPTPRAKANTPKRRRGK